MRLRSPAEIGFRLNQEVRNAILLKTPPALTADISGIRPPFPATEPVIERIRGGRLAESIVAEARQILDHRFALLGLTIETGPEIRWRRDYVNGKETGTLYFRRLVSLDANQTGNHKFIWELNRHQHLVVLAQAYRLTGDAEFLAELRRQLESWIAANPFQRGINWVSALEVAFRALSWMWIDHLAGAQWDPQFRRKFLDILYQHGHHLAANLSVYHSPNTHLLGESLALHGLGLMFRGTPPAGRWVRVGGRTVQEQMLRQVRADGSHFEQSSYYHVYALDMFAFHAVLAAVPESYKAALARMAEYLNALMGPNRRMPLIGDDDGGRFFHPYGDRQQFGRASLATCGVLLGRPEWLADAEDLEEQCLWWLGPQAPASGISARATAGPRVSRYFDGAGAAVMVSGKVHAVFDAGPFGPFRSGHSHADTLSLVIQDGSEDVLIDPGTFTYLGDARWREEFRGTAAHNTVRIDQRDQAEPAGAFAWLNPPAVEMTASRTGAEEDYFEAVCRYRDFVHRRKVRFLKTGLFAIVDEVEGPAGEHELEQFWHLGPEAAFARLVLEEPVTQQEGWRSTAFGSKSPAHVLCVRQKTTLPCRIAAAVLIEPGSSASITRAGNEIHLHWRRAGGQELRIVL